MIFGYVRVSSKDQNPERQIEALKGYFLEYKKIKQFENQGKN